MIARMTDRSVLQLLNRAVDYFEQNLTRPALVEEAARQVGYSRYHFSRLFASTTGLTPTDYLRKRRLSAAAHQLAHTSTRILEIAYDFQFKSHEAFSRSFKREFGVSPNHYRLSGQRHPRFAKLTLGATRLLYPGSGITAKPRILIPEAPPLTAFLILHPKEAAKMTVIHGSVIRGTSSPANQAINVRPAERLDIPALCRLYHVLHEFTMQSVPDRLHSLGEFECFDATELSHSLVRLLDTIGMVILVAEYANELIGLAEVHLRQDEENPLRVNYRYGYLQSLVVASGWRNRGVGGQLLAAAETWCKTEGASELRLDSWEFEAGPLQFYTTQGYRTLRRTLVRSLT